MKPYYEHAGITIYHGDCLEILPSIQAHLCLTDPPYNVGEKYGESYRDQIELWSDWLGSRLAASTADEFVYFPGHRHFFDVPSIAILAGARIRRVLGWHKREFAGDLWTSGPAISWEPIVWMGRTDEMVFHKRFGTYGRDFLVVNSIHGNPFKGPHPCPKPLEVMRWLIGLFAPADGIVVDPFCGSGTTLEACKNAAIKAIGIEIEEKYCEIAAKRLSQEAFDFGPSDRLVSPTDRSVGSTRLPLLSVTDPSTDDG